MDDVKFRGTLWTTNTRPPKQQKLRTTAFRIASKLFTWSLWQFDELYKVECFIIIEKNLLESLWIEVYLL